MIIFYIESDYPILQFYIESQILNYSLSNNYDLNWTFIKTLV